MIGVITNLPGLPHKLEAPRATPSRLGAKPKSNKCKTNRLDEEIECSSLLHCFFTKSLLSTQSLARFEARSKEKKRERLLRARRHFSEVLGCERVSG
jgi:hypothetical protein